MSQLDVDIIDIIGEVVTATKNVVLSTIKSNEAAALGSTLIETINYQKGHVLELINTLSEMDRDTQSQLCRYPLIWLVLDIKEQRGREIGQYGAMIPNIIIAHYTEMTRKVDDRRAKVFSPVLEPIYREFMNQLSLHPSIMEGDPQAIQHDKIRRFFWGTQKEAVVSDKSKVRLTDYLDAIEISNLQLNLLFKNC